jgi:hypothetical protein
MFGAESPEISQATYLLGYRVMSYLALVVACMTVFMHVALSSHRITVRYGIVAYAALASFPVLFVFGRIVVRTRIPMENFVILILCFGLLAYVMIAELFLRWGADWLNRHRLTWVKELEYVYVVLGVLGLAVSINRMEIMDGKVEGLNLAGPLIVMLAVVVKMIKVRAEVSEWDKADVLRRKFE